MWFQFTLQAIGMVAGAIILHHALSALNAMNAGTAHGVRIAFVLIATGGFAQIVDPWIARESSTIADQLLACGLALLLVFDKRCVACPRALAVSASRRRRDEREMDGEKA